MSRHLDLSLPHKSTGASGFTLVEVLVSLAILTTALVPSFVVASDAVNLSTRIRNSLISSNLAQEGVEVVRAIRDDNWFAGRPFDTGLDACSAGCAVQYNSLTPLTGGQEKTFLRVDSDNGLYQYDTGPDTLYRRTITATSLSPGMKVASSVSWKERGTDRNVTLEYYLFDWKQ